MLSVDRLCFISVWRFKQTALLRRGQAARFLLAEWPKKICTVHVTMQVGKQVIHVSIRPDVRFPLAAFGLAHAR